MTHDALVEAARRVFERGGAEIIDPDYVLPADLPLELSGEIIRPRLCIFTGARGEEYVMRPDLTLPVAAREAARREVSTTGEKAYTYAARAFRLPAASDDPVEFTQVGFEHFGAPSGPASDAAAFLAVIDAVQDCRVKTAQILTGDLAIFPAFIDALGLSPLMTGRLKRAFRQEGGLKAMLESEAAPLPEAAQKILASAEPVAALEQALAAQNVDMFGARSLGEIVEGLAARAEHSEAGELPAHARDCFAALGAVSCALPDAPGTLLRLSRAHGLANTENVIEQLAERIRLIQPQAIRALCQFRTGFGRRFTYYDGFLFEVFGLGLTERQPIAAGGRYDGLITALSFGRASASGIGGVVRPDRMLRVERAA